MKAKTYTIRINTIRAYGKDSSREVSGTLEELTEYFSYTLEIGNLHPKTIRGLISAVQKASDIKTGCTYIRDWYELVK